MESGFVLGVCQGTPASFEHPTPCFVVQKPITAANYRWPREPHEYWPTPRLFLDRATRADYCGHVLIRGVTAQTTSQ